MASKGANRVVKNGPVKQTKKRPSSKTDDVPKEQLLRAVAQANKIGQLLDKRLSFDIDRETNKVIVKVIDKGGKVLRMIPPSQMIRMAAHLNQLKVLNDRVIGAAESVILDQES